jgi:hypothetical protein
MKGQSSRRIPFRRWKRESHGSHRYRVHMLRWFRPVETGHDESAESTEHPGGAYADFIPKRHSDGGGAFRWKLASPDLAARYSDQLVALAGGTVYAAGPAAAVLTERCVQDVSGLRSRIIEDPVSGGPMVVPVGRHHVRRCSDEWGSSRHRPAHPGCGRLGLLGPSLLSSC